MKVQQQSVEDVRKALGRLAQDAAQGAMDGHVVVTRHGTPSLVVVDLDWYRKARRAMKDPTDL